MVNLTGIVGVEPAGWLAHRFFRSSQPKRNAKSTATFAIALAFRQALRLAMPDLEAPHEERAVASWFLLARALINGGIPGLPLSSGFVAINPARHHGLVTETFLRDIAPFQPSDPLGKGNLF